MSEGAVRLVSMSKASPRLADSVDARLEALAGAASILDWPLPRERDEAMCAEMARCTEALLVRVARGWGALNVTCSRAERRPSPCSEAGFVPVVGVLPYLMSPRPAPAFALFAGLRRYRADRSVPNAISSSGRLD
jgi:hypothetical protein